MATLHFKTLEHLPAAALALIPSGRYRAVIVDSITRRARSGDGRFLQLAFQIDSGEHRDRVIWARLHLDSRSRTTVRIAEAELAAICRAVGREVISNSSELHDTPLMIEVGTRVRDSGDLVNCIKKYERVG